MPSRPHAGGIPSCMHLNRHINRICYVGTNAITAKVGCLSGSSSLCIEHAISPDRVCAIALPQSTNFSVLNNDQAYSCGQLICAGSAVRNPPCYCTTQDKQSERQAMELNGSPNIMSQSNVDDSKEHSSSSSILPLYEPGPSPPDRRSRLDAFLSSSISYANTSYLLLICCFMTGLLDSTLFYAYGTFVSGQTGNTILLGLGASSSHTTTRPYRWTKSLLAIICFLCGCACFSHTMRILGKLKRGTLVLSFVIQGAIVLLVGGFVQAQLVEGRLHLLTEEMDWRQCMPIALLSFQSAGQIVTSRALKLNEIPTVVLTSMLHDIATDPKFFAPWRSNVKRNQMLSAFAATLLGALVGGFISISTGQMQSTLWLVGGLKLGIAGAWMVWPAGVGEDGI